METGVAERKAETAKTEKGNEYEVYRTQNPVFSGSGFTNEAMESRTNMIEDAINRNLVDDNMANLLKAYLAPKDHPNHMKLKAAVAKYFPGEDVTKIRNQAQTAATKILGDLWYGENNINFERARNADENATTKRSRTREEIARDKAVAEAEKNARKKLGIPQSTPFLALEEEAQKQLTNELRDSTD